MMPYLKIKCESTKACVRSTRVDAQFDVNGQLFYPLPQDWKLGIPLEPTKPGAVFLKICPACAANQVEEEINAQLIEQGRLLNTKENIAKLLGTREQKQLSPASSDQREL